QVLGSGGLIQTNNVLDMQADSATLDGGTSVAKQVNINSATLSNRGGSVQQTGTDSAHITASTVLDNSGGSIATNGHTEIKVGDINNQGGSIRAAGNSDITLTASGALDNSALASVASAVQAGGALTINAASLNNHAAHITAGQGLMLNTHSTKAGIDNSAGMIASNQDVTLHAAQINNASGSIGSANGAITLFSTDVSMNNAAGTVIAAQAFKLTAQGLDNRGGTLQANTLSVNTQQQALDNSHGTILSTANANLQTGALLNDAGLLQAGADLLINTHGLSLSNINSGSTQGILSQGALNIVAGDFNNQTGSVGASGNVAVQSQSLGNQHGNISGAAAISLTATQLDNQQGRIEALGQIDAAASTTINNQLGLIRSALTANLNAATIDNSQTAGDEHGIQAGSVSLRADQINNMHGQILADHALALTGSAALNNSQGVISSSGSLTIKDSQAAENSNVAQKTLAISNTGGRIAAGTDLRIDSQSLSGDGSVVSHGDLSTKLTSDYTNNGQWQAGGNASLVTTGRVVNHMALQAGADLQVQAAQLDNLVSGQIIGANTELDAGSSLTNRGLIDGAHTYINATTVNNIGSGRIYGDQIAIGTQTLNNDAETVNGTTAAAVIAARNQLDIGAAAINNREHALLFSAGNMAIGGALDANHAATAAKGQLQVGALSNASATIEALGNLSLNANHVSNSNEHFSTQTAQVSTEAMELYQLADHGDHHPHDLITRYTRDQVELWHDSDGVEMMTALATGEFSDARNEYRFNRTIAETQVVSSDPGQILSGGAMTIAANSVLNDKSKIIAGGTLEHDIQNLKNQGAEGKKITTDVGNAIHYYRIYLSGKDRSGKTNSHYAPAPVENTISLAASVFKDHSSVTGTGIQLASLATSSVDQSISGAGSAQVALNDASKEQSHTKLADLHATDARAIDAVSAAAVDTQTAALNQLNAAALTQAGSVAITAAAQLNAVNAAAVDIPAQAVSQAAAAGAEQAGSVAATSAAAPATLVHTITPNITLPTNSLFHTNPQANNHYLVATDPQFVNYRTWLSSDYLLNASGHDPALQMKRLGDGFYEQSLIRDQITQLTGRRFVAGYDNDEAGYMALMSNGASFAKKFQISLGVALDATQMAQLTSDIVWLVSKTVRLPDGSSTEVLVPQVYVRLQPGDISSTGALISGASVDIKATGSVDNSGSIAGRTAVAITADQINNLGGRIHANQTALNAKTDINNIGGSISAKDSLRVHAERDLNVITTTSTQSNAQGSVTHVDRVAGLYVDNPHGLLIASAGKDLQLTAAQISNAGAKSETSLSAGHKLVSDTVSTAEQNRIVWDNANYLEQGSTQEVGTQINTAGNLVLSAQQDMSLKAANIHSDTGNITAIAANNIDISNGVATQNLNSASKSSSHGWLSSSTTTTHNSIKQTDVIASSLSGDSVNVLAGYSANANGELIKNASGNLTVSGSQIVATNDVNLMAANDVTIQAAASTQQNTTSQQKTESGLFGGGGGIGFTIGSREQAGSDANNKLSQVASVVGSTGAKVNIQAGNRYSQIGSDVLAAQGDVQILANKVNISAATDTTQAKQTQHSKQSGLSVALSNPVLSAANSVQQMGQAQSQVSDPRLKTLAAASAALAVKQAAASVASDPNSAGGIHVSISVGSSQSSSTSEQSSQLAAASRVQAGGNVAIVASGDPAQKDANSAGNITISGSHLNAGGHAALIADGDITLQSAQNSSQQSSSNHSSSASLGV
ncbi:beta strand repeat-containing protein, partial [Undibacterium sp. 5I2]